MIDSPMVNKPQLWTKFPCFSQRPINQSVHCYIVSVENFSITIRELRNYAKPSETIQMFKESLMGAKEIAQQ